MQIQEGERQFQIGKKMSSVENFVLLKADLRRVPVKSSQSKSDKTLKILTVGR